MELQTFVDDFGNALKKVDESGERHKHFRPGIGPFGETSAVKAALAVLKEVNPSNYISAAVKRQPDLLIPGQWAIEFKIIRPFGDNGKPAEHWSENILHPYSGNTGSLGDCLKLMEMEIPEKKAVVIFGYEHEPSLVPLDPAIHAFELIARQILVLPIGERITARRTGLIHPVHQVLRVFGYQVNEKIN